MITLWGRPNSLNVQKALWALDELGLEFEHVDAGGAAGGSLSRPQPTPSPRTAWKADPGPDAPVP